jgi:type 1 glutamine amidotransferase
MTVSASVFFALALAAAPIEGDLPLKPRAVAPGVYTLATQHRYAAANVGWVVLSDQVLLIGAPHPDVVLRCLDEIASLTDKPVKAAILTHVREGELAAARTLSAKGIVIHATHDAAERLKSVEHVKTPGQRSRPAGWLREFTDRMEWADSAHQVEAIALGHAAGQGDAAVFVRDAQVLFPGEVSVNGPRAELPGSRTEAWIDALRRLRSLPSKTVVPGFGTTGGPEILDRLARFLREIRRQVAYRVCQGRPLEAIATEVRIEPEWLVWMPYDTPTKPDIEHLYNELTVPRAPFGDRPFAPDDRRPRALVLIGDRPHEPGHLEDGLRPAFEQAGIDARFVFDVRALNAENLKRVQLLVVLRDGAIWPDRPDGPYTVWMTRAQEDAVVSFVEGGGGFLALHNCTGIYPEGGPYLKLLGGTYTGHGPLERFRVHVLDRDHPVTKGVEEYEVADEQHTPIPDRSKVHLILESRSADGVVAAAGWVHEPGKGRVCYLANGHTRDALNHPMFRRLVVNGARWCVKQGDAAGGEKKPAKDSAGAANLAPLPGRIFLSINDAPNPLRGIVAIDPNDFTWTNCLTERTGFSTVSPDGQWIAFDQGKSEPNQDGVWIAPVDGEVAPKRVFDQFGSVWWSGDGERLLICAIKRGGGYENESWIINRDGSGRRKLALAATEQVWAWSPDGQWVLSFSARTRADGSPAQAQLTMRPLSIAHPDGSSERTLVPESPAPHGTFKGTRIRNPAFSPDSRTVAYCQYDLKENGTPRRSECSVWVVDIAGSNRRCVLKGDASADPLSAVWSPDGRSLAVAFRRIEGEGVTATLRVVDLSGSLIREIPFADSGIFTVVDWR